MTTIVTRAGKGTALTYTEMDANFTNLNTEKAPTASPTFTGTVTSPRNYNVSSSYGSLQVGGVDVMLFGANTSGQLTGFRNILINGKLSINQRGVSIATAANGSYGPDRWKKVDSSNMTQIIESGNYVPSTTYTLSGTGITTRPIISPESGNWTLPNIPIAATHIQLELGSIATPFEYRPIGLELSLCQRYYERLNSMGIAIPFATGQCYSTTITEAPIYFTTKRTVPTLTYSIGDGCYCRNASGTEIVTSAIESTGGTLNSQAIRFTVASGLIAGNASSISFYSGGHWIAFSSEL